MTSVGELSTLTPAEKRVLLRRLLEQQHASRGEQRDEGTDLALSAGQEWLWLMQQRSPSTAAYHFPFALRIRSAVDEGALRRALQTLIDRHAALRTRFEVRDGQPVQIVAESAPAVLDVVDASGWDETELRTRVAADADRVIDLTNGPVFRGTLYHVGEADAVLLLVWHHLVLDGWSLGVVLDELDTILSAHAAGGEPSLDRAEPYASFVTWQQALLTGPEGARQSDYWRSALAGAERLDLVTDHTRPPVSGHRGGSLFFTLGERMTSEVAQVAAAHGTTAFVVLLAAFEATLYRMTARERFVVSFPMSGRTEPRFARTVGYLANHGAVAAHIDATTTMRALIAQAQARVLGALANQDWHLSRMPQSEDGAPRVGEAMFVLQQARAYRLEAVIGARREPGIIEDGEEIVQRGTLGGLVVESFPLAQTTARFDLELQMMEHGDALYGWLQYDRELFEPHSARALADRFLRVVAALVADVDALVSRVDVVTDDERARLQAWNDTQRDWPSEGGISALFERQARRTPGAAAAVCGRQRITFAELDARANQLARWLQRRGATPEDVVGVAVPRSIDMLVALLGTIKAGCTYLALDPANPPERLRYMVRDSRARFVITSSETCATYRRGEARHVCLHCDADAIAALPTSAPPATEAARLYIVYTSGSTGEPKGVVGMQAATLNRFRWMWERYPFVAGEVFAQVTTLGFVDAVWEIFGPLLRGVPIAIVPDDAVRDADRLVETLEQHRVTRITLVPSLLRVLLDTPALRRRLARLRLWSSSGEAMPPDLVHRFQETLPDATLLNLYGCSEAAADSCCFEVPRGWRGDRVPIGRPIANTQIWLLDRHGALAAPGTLGEIHIAGAGLAGGYLHRPELTAERFVANPFARGERMYRTGDLGRHLPDGSIEYFGRLDQQIKVRGNRVEPGEIERALREHAEVESAAVVGLREPSGDHVLVAYVVARSTSLTDRTLRAHLAARVPAYMLPTRYVWLEAMPLTSSGKIDRRALPEPPVREEAHEHVAPRTATERVIAGVWADVLGVPAIGVDDDFFEWGGHSLLALQAAARMSRALDRRLPADLINRLPTVALLAAYVDGERGTGRPHQLVAVRSAGSKPPLFWIPGGAGSLIMLPLRDLATRLGPDRPLYGVGTRRAESLDEVESVPERARAYVAAIREQQPKGPYHLTGFCLGGVIAFEMAQQLVAAGESVAFLGLINTWFPPDAITGAQWLAIFAQRAVHHVRVAASGAKGPALAYLRDRGHVLRRILRRGATTASPAGTIAMNGDAARPGDDAVLDATVRLARTYVPSRFDGTVHVFLSEEPDLAGVSARVDPRRAWRRVCSAIESIRVRGGHDAILDSAFIDRFGAQLRAALDAADAPHDAQPAITA